MFNFFIDFERIKNNEFKTFRVTKQNVENSER